MSSPFSLKAQALDNTSPDDYQIGNELLAADDQARRRDVTNLISEVAREGTLVLKEGGAELFVKGNQFLAQVYSEQADNAGRRAPILCCGEFGRTDDPNLVIQSIKSFAEKIGRTVDPTHIKDLRVGLARLKKKRQALPRAFSIGIAVLLSAVILAMLQQRRLSRTHQRGSQVPAIRMQTPGS